MGECVSQDVVAVVVGPADTAAMGFNVSGGTVPQARSEVARRPTAVVANESGRPVVASGSGSDVTRVDGLLARVGDPVPVRVGGCSWPAEDLVARVVADVVDAVAPTSPDHVVVAVPDEWRAYRRTALHVAVHTTTGSVVTTVGAATGLLGTDGVTSVDGTALVLDAGAEHIRASACQRVDDGWVVRRSGEAEWGATDIDDALLDFVRERSSAAEDLWADRAGDARAACSAAREDLIRTTATEVELPGSEPVRIVRADLETLIGGAVADLVDRLLEDVADPDAGATYSQVIATGALASMPVVVEAVSRATGQAVEHVTCVEVCRRYAVAGLAAVAAAPVATAGEDGQETENTVTTMALHTGRGPRSRRPAGLAAAALAAAAAVAAVSLTDAGEAAVRAVIEQVVPSGGTPGVELNEQGDVMALPAPPWKLGAAGGDESGDPEDSADTDPTILPDDTSSDGMDGSPGDGDDGSDGAPAEDLSAEESQDADAAGGDTTAADEETPSDVTTTPPDDGTTASPGDGEGAGGDGTESTGDGTTDPPPGGTTTDPGGTTTDPPTDETTSDPPTDETTSDPPPDETTTEPPPDETTTEPSDPPTTTSGGASDGSSDSSTSGQPDPSTSDASTSSPAPDNTTSGGTSTP